MSKKNDKGRKVKIQRVRLRGDASEEAALRIAELARGLRSGVIHLADGDVSIEAPAGSDLSWEIEARSGRRKSRIEIEIRWRAPESHNEDEDEDEEDDDEDEETETESASDEPAPDPLATGLNPQSSTSPDETPASPEEEKPSPELENPAW
jgi:amphi-Trp domain-containing protein